jgi:ABC-type Fe3+-siderophore transport system permease subunit
MLWVARVMQIAAFGLAVLTLFIPTGVNWFVIVFALIGFGFSAAYTLLLLKRNPGA